MNLDNVGARVCSALRVRFALADGQNSCRSLSEEKVNTSVEHFSQVLTANALKLEFGPSLDLFPVMQELYYLINMAQQRVSAMFPQVCQ